MWQVKTGYGFVRSPRMKEVMENSKISKVLSMLDDIMIFVSRGENRFAMGFPDVEKCIDACSRIGGILPLDIWNRGRRRVGQVVKYCRKPRCFSICYRLFHGYRYESLLTRRNGLGLEMSIEYPENSL